MPGLFSVYNTPENRVTGTLIAVLERINVALVEQIFQSALEESELRLVSFVNQPSRGAAGIPDARIFGGFCYWLETKRVRGALHGEHVTREIERHLKRVLEPMDAWKVPDPRVVVLTPDETRPPLIDEIRARHGLVGTELVWTSFDFLSAAIAEITRPAWEATDELPNVRPTEREVYLLEELAAFFLQEGLIRDNIDDRVLIVPAGQALDAYVATGAYICQPGRTFRPSGRLAFYRSNRIDRRMPRILASIESVTWTQEGLVEALADAQLHPERLNGISSSDLERRMKALYETILGEPGRAGGINKVILLTPNPDLSDADRLDRDIKNDIQSASGRRTAFVQNQRYASLKKLRAAATTSDLLNREKVVPNPAG